MTYEKVGNDLLCLTKLIAVIIYNLVHNFERFLTNRSFTTTAPTLPPPLPKHPWFQNFLQ